MGRSAASIAKNSARARVWAQENRERVNAQRRVSRAKARPARPEMTEAEKLEDTQYQNWLEYERRIRVVVARAIDQGTIERGPWYDMTVDEYLATPLPPYHPASRTTRLAPAAGGGSR